jgi:hypothetical protein
MSDPDDLSEVPIALQVAFRRDEQGNWLPPLNPQLHRKMMSSLIKTAARLECKRLGLKFEPK